MSKRKRARLRKDNFNPNKFFYIKGRMLIADNHGRLAKMKSANRVFKDLLGEKKVASKMFSSYGIRTIGDIKTLAKLLANDLSFSMIADLVNMQHRMNTIKEMAKKKKKKGKKISRDIVKEFESIEKLYKKGVKTTRKRYGLKNDLSVKSQYRFISNAVKNKDEFYDDYFDDDYDLDDPYEEEFNKVFMGKSFNRRDINQYLNDYANSLYDDDDEDDEDDIYDLVDDEDDQVDYNTSEIANINQRIDQLASMMTNMNQPQVPIYTQPFPQSQVQQVQQVPDLTAITATINRIGNQVENLTDVVKDLHEVVYNSDEDEEDDYEFSESELVQMKEIVEKMKPAANQENAVTVTPSTI